MPFQPPLKIEKELVRKIINCNAQGAFELTPSWQREYGGFSSCSTQPQIIDLLEPVIGVLNDDLLPNTPLRQEFEDEFRHDALTAVKAATLGEWFYYPSKHSLVRFAPKRWHQLSLLTRNGSLLYPPQQRLNWQKAREISEKAVIAVAGASVGSNILHSSVMLLRPKAIKVADPKQYQFNNANRVRLQQSEIGRNKAIVCAEQITDLDPFIATFPYSDGIHLQNMERFIYGNSKDEPKASLVVEETDNPSIKMALRKMAREARIPLVMVTDIGCAVQVDVRRFDRDPQTSLCVGVPDHEALAKLSQWEQDPLNRQKFFEVALALSGRETILSVEDFRSVVTNPAINTFAGIPQLGSSATIGAGLAAWMISQILLGYEISERTFLNASDFLKVAV